ncbi:cholesterol side-chain cleavage enzyme, mitochondrial-like, partial [Malurus melanocephalus]|uniref:cholesterol side-chain cleavage enzyme, mitochondrial-like n=1 Tax=Malurus melanocephalus TaxID=175006 RepID=UPI0025484CAF
VEAEAQRFIAAVALMFHTTAPMLHVPPALLRRLNAPAWRRHVQAWDAIFAQADKCIQSVYRDLRLQRKSPQEHVGVLGNLILRDAMALGDIRASVTEMMAGGVDTTSMTLQWALWELARAPGVQEQLRSEVLAAKRDTGGDRARMLQCTPLLKATIKETLRQFRPQRWLAAGPKPFQGLSFGFGPRQCLGRRIAEIEMQLFLMHILENFKIETMRAVEIGTKFDLILIPDKPIQLTLRPLESQP